MFHPAAFNRTPRGFPTCNPLKRASQQADLGQIQVSPEQLLQVSVLGSEKVQNIFFLVAQYVCSGVIRLAVQSRAYPFTLSDCAHERALNLNTIYTHLRRLREKTGCNRVPELIHKLNELRLPLPGD